MAFPRKLLSPGEDVIVEEFPNWSVLARPITVALALAAASVAILAYWVSAPIWIAYGLGALCVGALCWLGAKVVAWRSRLLVVTTRRVIYRWGVFRRTGREIPLERVQDVTYHQTLFERLVGAGSLTVESAGASGQEPFPDVRQPAEIQSLVNRLISGEWQRPVRATVPDRPPARPAPAPDPVPVRPVSPGPAPAPPASPAPGAWDGVPGWAASPVTPAYGGAGVPPSPGGAAPPAPAMPGGALGDQLRELERLHELGVITAQEFDAKRREILGLS